MKIISDSASMQAACSDLRLDRRRIGCVPTMGALHEGHLSLLAAARQRTDTVVMTIFVNPAQFDPAEDLAKYPRSFEKDCELAASRGCDILFAPLPADMYPQGYRSYVSVEDITAKLEGASRPGHFRGVTTVVLKLLNIVMPHIGVFGQKDAQQAIILKRMVRDFNLPVALVIAPTVREKDGLAFSSRNVYLTEKERAAAPLIFRGLAAAEQEHGRGELSAEKLITKIRAVYRETALFKPEYIAIVNAETLDPVERICGTTLIAAACRTKESNTRLIDNIVLGGTL